MYRHRHIYIYTHYYPFKISCLIIPFPEDCHKLGSPFLRQNHKLISRYRDDASKTNQRLHEKCQVPA